MVVGIVVGIILVIALVGIFFGAKHINRKDLEKIDELTKPQAKK
jgi:hypothetical protein